MLSSLVLSCQQDSLTPSQDSTKPEPYLVFQGFNVVKPANVPLEVLTFKTNKEVAQFLGTIPKNSPNGREAVASEVYDPELFYRVVEKVVRSYPDLSNRPYVSSDKQRIHKDFPAIITDEDILKNSDIILAYYERLMQFDLSVELAKLQEVQKGARIVDYNAPGTNIYEQALVNQHPAAGLSMRDARWDAESWTDEKFATHIPDKWRGNAFKHMVWNAQGVKKMIWQGYSQWTAYDLTKQFTTAHERDPNVNNGNLDPNNIDTAMDLHNNAQGRSYMKNNISWGVFGLRSMPSESSIKNDMANHCNDDVNQIRYLTSASAILALTYGDVNALADANYVSYPNAVRIQ